MKEIIIAPSLLAANFNKLEEELKEIKKYGAKYIHLDVMDGLFVPNISFGLPVIESIRKNSDLVFDVHLMINEPERYIDDFCKAGADILTVHIESTKHIHRVIQKIKSNNIKAGIAINPGTPISSIKEIIDMVDMVLVMTVNPGFGGQKFIKSTLNKIKEIRNNYPDIDIEVDGGINDETAKLVKKAGANILVAGSYIFSGDYKNKIEALKNE